MAAFIRAACVVFLSLSVARGDQNQISLNGDKWTLSDEAGKVKNIQATVPGVTHLDLINAKIIKDPYYGFNDQNYEWVAYSNWTYSLEFQLAQDDIKGKTVLLKCDGLDTIANVTLNGKFVGYADNYYREWLFDVTDAVASGSNKLEIFIESAANYSVRMRKAYPYPVYRGGDYIPGTDRNFIRKTQSDFGWDWGPCFVPAGIWQNISIVTYNEVYVSGIFPKAVYNDEEKSYHIDLLVCMRMDMGGSFDISATVDIPDTPFTKLDMKNGTKVEGESCIRYLSKSVKSSDMDAHLWRPRTSRNPTPKLYKAHVVVTVKDKKDGSQVTQVAQSKNIGFNNVEIKTPPPPDGKEGELFYFTQSDSKGTYPMYIKGSNFIPMDAFVTRATPEVARRLLESAINGNQNMIRIWGGGLYQPDWFYDICDELGLMVWQEFMFAVALYPRDKDFLANVGEEVKYTVRRLGNHPSIVLWSGNNENQDYATKTSAGTVDYSILYDQVVRATLWREDTSRPYWPSSPSNGVLVDDPSRDLYIQRWGETSNPIYGDVHRYNYDALCNDVSTFPRPRFASEFGFQAYPSYNAMKGVCNTSELDNNSTFMLHRQHHPKGNAELASMMSRFFHMPDNKDKSLQFRDFIFLTQVVQSICITSEAEHYRRLLSESGAYTRGTLYWQLNDIWQAQTWSSIEYGGRWKLLHYTMKKAYEEVAVSAYQLSGRVCVYVVVDQPDMTLKYDLHINVIKWKDGSVGKQLKQSSLVSQGFTGTHVFNKSLTDVFEGTSVTESFLYITVTQAGSTALIADTWFYPSSFTKVDLPLAQVMATNMTMSGDMTVKFTLSSDKPSPYVMLDSGSLDGYFSDNGFLVLPHIQYDMTFTSWKTFDVNDFKTNLYIRTIYDTYHH